MKLPYIWSMLLLMFETHIDGAVSHTRRDITQTSKPLPTETFPHQAKLDEQGNYFLFWKFDEETITFEVHAKTKGWVGFGLSNNGAMKGADIVVGWIKDGNATIKDYHGIGNQRPLLDSMQNCKLLASLQEELFTIIKFSRKLETCDKDDYQIQDGTVRVMFAWSNVIPEGDESISYHGAGNRGSKSLLLLDHVTKTANGNLDTKTFSLTVNNVTVPTKVTYYHCRIVALPNITEKHHITKIKPLIQDGNEGVVHHIIVHMCYGAVQQEVYGRDCWTNGTLDTVNCGKMTYAWGIGGEEYMFPEEAALSVGGEDDARFYELEVHYDNPQLLPDIVDSSGFEFHYTPDLKPHDVGILILGHALQWPPMIIPPKADVFRIDTYCGSTCTSKIPSQGIQVFGALPHTHLAGSKIWTRHVRNGTELPEIVRDDHYDFDYQIFRTLKEHRTIYPMDEFITTCVYHTSQRDKLTVGGLGTYDEMCLTFLLYYPKIDLDSCLSDRPPAEVTNYLVKSTWSDADITDIQLQFDKSTTFRQTCATGGWDTFGHSNASMEPVVKIRTHFVKNATCSEQSDTTVAPSGDTSGSRGPAHGASLSLTWIILAAVMTI